MSMQAFGHLVQLLHGYAVPPKVLERQTSLSLVPWPPLPYDSKLIAF